MIVDAHPIGEGVMPEAFVSPTIKCRPMARRRDIAGLERGLRWWEPGALQEDDSPGGEHGQARRAAWRTR